MRNFSKLNSLLKSANTLKALPKNVLLYNLMTASARFLKYWLRLMRYSESPQRRTCFFKSQAVLGSYLTGAYGNFRVNGS